MPVHKWVRSVAQAQNEMSDFLFSYGTLLPEHAPAEIAAGVAKLRPHGKGSVSGVLFDFGDYPGALLDDLSNKRIFGTVFRLPKDPTLLDELDRYEGFDPASPGASLFVRKRCRATLSNGRIVDCWIYEYNGKPGTTQQVVASGRYRKRDVAIR